MNGRAALCAGRSGGDCGAESGTAAGDSGIAVARARVSNRNSRVRRMIAQRLRSETGMTAAIHLTRLDPTLLAIRPNLQTLSLRAESHAENLL